MYIIYNFAFFLSLNFFVFITFVYSVRSVNKFPIPPIFFLTRLNITNPYCYQAQSQTQYNTTKKKKKKKKRKDRETLRKTDDIRKTAQQQDDKKTKKNIPPGL